MAIFSQLIPLHDLIWLNPYKNVILLVIKYVPNQFSVLLLSSYQAWHSNERV